MSLRFVFFIFVFLPACLQAQVEPQTEQTDQLEQLLLQNGELNPDLLQIRLDNLQELLDHPMNLKNASFEDWVATGLVTEAQALAYALHVGRYGELIELEELQSIEGWDMATVRRVLPYVQLGKEKVHLKGMSGSIFNGKKELLLRTVFPRNDLITDAWEGRPQGYFIRFRSNADGNVRWGFTAETDPGESFFSKSNKQGFDFYSAHFYVRNVSKKIKAITLGDFQARFGQGLLLEPGFAPGKSSETTSLLRAGPALRPYSSQGEVQFFRGAGITYQWKKGLESTFFYSQRQKDANRGNAIDTLDGVFNDIAFFTSLQATGLHRTEAEIEDERSTQERVAGANIAWEKRGKRLALNGLWTAFDRTFEPSSEAYRLYAFRGESLYGASVDYRLPFRSFLMFGETAFSENRQAATTNGFVFLPYKKLTFSLLHRHLSSKYQTLFAAPFGETIAGSNETGLYFGLKYAPSRVWRFSAYVDVWRHPWLRFRTDGPSSGNDFLLRVDWVRRRKTNVYAQFQSRIKEQNALSSSEYIGLVSNQRSNLRFHLEHQIERSLKLRSRVEWSFFRTEQDALSRGVLAYQEAVFSRIGIPVRFSARYALFDALDANARLFAFETDVTSALSVPSFSGRGSRFYINLQYLITRRIRLQMRYGNTHFRQADALTKPAENRRDFKVQLSIKW